VPVVVGVAVVVPGRDVIPQLGELLGQGDGHILVGAGGEGGLAAEPVGDQAGHHGELAAGGGLGPVGLVVVVEHKALVGQLVQGGGELLADDVGGEGLGGDEDQVFPLEHAGVLVLLGGSQAPEVLVQGLDGVVGGAGGQGLKVDVQLIVAVD